MAQVVASTKLEPMVRLGLTQIDALDNALAASDAEKVDNIVASLEVLWSDFGLLLIGQPATIPATTQAVQGD